MSGDSPEIISSPDIHKAIQLLVYNFQTNLSISVLFCFVLLFSEQEVTIHGLGSAINRAINLALQLEQRGQGTVEVT